MVPNRRFEELDSLRGIAALNVVLFHCTTLLGITAALPVLYFTPIEILLAGHQAVIFFFLLSGFVLSLPYFMKGQMQRYRTFLIRRIARLYPPYLTAITFGLIMRLLFDRLAIYPLWTGVIGWKTILQHLFMIDQFSQQPYDPVIWSLVMEMRIALIFPLLLWFVSKVHWRWSLLAGFSLSMCGIALHVRYAQTVDFYTNYFDTFHYMLMFIAGSVIAKHQEGCKRIYKKLGIWGNAPLAVLAFVIYTWAYSYLSQNLGLAGALVSDWFTMLCACYFLVAGLSSHHFGRILRLRPIHFLGRISYSIYLLHLVVFLALINLLWHVVSPYVILSATVFITLGLASLSYYYIEVPSIGLGRYFTRDRTKPPLRDDVGANYS